MELKTLLQNSGWEESDVGFSKKAISRNANLAINKNIKVLIYNNYKALALNLLFLSISVYLYIQNPTVNFLIPSILIASCFLFLIITVWSGINAANKIDHAQSVTLVLSEVLDTNKKMYQHQCRYHSVLITQGFTGGFLLGLAFQGWTVERTIEEPIIFVFIVPMAVGVYYLTKTKSFRSLNRALNPKYFQAKSYLEEQLTLLQE